MHYSVTVEIDLPRQRVIELFDNPDNMPHWQPTLLSFQHVSGELGQTGAISELKYQMGKREITMIETITERNLPDVFSATYETKGVWNQVSNHFVEQDGKTMWTMNTVFKCTGMLRIMAWLMPGMFKKQTTADMLSFKAFAEPQ
jgi:carbon monoxide dehydrogenase subunit G